MSKTLTTLPGALSEGMHGGWIILQKIVSAPTQPPLTAPSLVTCTSFLSSFLLGAPPRAEEPSAGGRGGVGKTHPHRVEPTCRVDLQRWLLAGFLKA